MKRLVLICALFLFGCSVDAPSSIVDKAESGVTYEVLSDGPDVYGMYRFHDDEKNVTCWFYRGYEAGGLSCIPDSQLDN